MVNAGVLGRNILTQRAPFERRMGGSMRPQTSKMPYRLLRPGVVQFCNHAHRARGELLLCSV